MPIRLIECLGRESNDVYEARVASRRNKWGEWVVRAFDVKGWRLPDADYYTQNREDAKATACAMTTIYVFGSNPLGYHGGGAARFALDHCGAIWGQAEGLQGRSYGIITKEVRLGYPQIVVPQIARGVQRFLAFARQYPGLNFWVAAIGCNISVFKPNQIGPLFRGHPANVQLCKEFQPYAN